MVERWSVKPVVVGSSPTASAKKIPPQGGKTLEGATRRANEWPYLEE